MRRWLIASVLAVLALGSWTGRAEAARNFVGTQIPAPDAPVTMGTTGTLTYRIANASTGGNASERIYEVRFRMRGGRSTFSSTTAAPAGWTRTAFGTTSMTFRATSWADAIAAGAFLDFPVIFNFRSTNVDTNEDLRDIRARFTRSTGGPPFNNVGTDTDSNQGGWTLKSLEAMFQFTDLTGTPITSLVAGDSYRLVMTVTNRSTSTQSSIVSVPNPPTQNASFSGGPPPSHASTVYSPSPLTLAPGASGTITFTYTTAPNAYGTVYYTAYTRNNNGRATSALATSSTLSVGLFTATINLLPASCLYSGQSFTVEMMLTNNYAFAITGVVPTMTVSLGGAPLILTSGPTYSSNTIPGGGTLQVTWDYQVTTAANGETFTFDGTAAGTGGGQPRAASASSLPAKAGGYAITATQTNASSTNEEIGWTFINNGCAATDSVAIDFPLGWAWDGGSEDSYSFVRVGGGAWVENQWTVAGSGPVTFSASVLADQQAVGENGNYRLTFSSTPSAPGTGITVTITDATGYPSTIPSTVTINPYNFGSLNDADTDIWQEDFR
jgi:hypothetical protein